MYPSAPAMQFIAIRFMISSVLAARSIPSTAFFVMRIVINKIEITTGKLSTAISTLLLLALDAMPEIKLNDAENPSDPKNKAIKNRRLS